MASSIGNKERMDITLTWHQIPVTIYHPVSIFFARPADVIGTYPQSQIHVAGSGKCLTQCLSAFLP